MVGSPLAGIPFQQEVSSLNIAQCAQFLEKSSERPAASNGHVADLFGRVNHRDALHLCRLLRSQHEGPSRRAADETNKTDEIAAPHCRDPSADRTNLAYAASRCPLWVINGPEQLVDARAIELWCGERFVAKFEPKPRNSRETN